MFGGTTYGTKFNLEYMHVFYTISLRGIPPYPSDLIPWQSSFLGSSVEVEVHKDIWAWLQP